MIRKAFPLLALATIALAGCAAQIGPKTIPHSRFDYGEALVRSWDQ